ncbi:MAG: ligase 1 [Gaiellales bacterium]|jgi:DNA ligase-1|nr:ligase 1 [Gaiellales bacterium]
MLLRDIVDTSEAVAATRSRSAKIEALAACIARMEHDEAAVGAGFLAGEPRQRRMGVGWASLRELPPAATEPSLTVTAVDAAFERLAGLAGSGSQAERRRLLGELFAAATGREQEFLRRLVLGDLRQGALQSIVTDAVAKAAGIPQAEVRRALMLLGDAGDLARIALSEGVEGLRQVRLQVGRPVQPMLAGTAPDLGAALEKIRPAALEWKLDGARIQVHRSGDDVGVYTRSLDDVTGSVPEIVEAVLALDADPLVLDGEAIALRPDGRPHPFQITGSRFGSRRSVDELRRSTPLTPFMFDVLHANGDDLLDLPGSERAERLAAIVPEVMRVPRLVVESDDAAAAFQADALARGHEGVLVKSLDAPYAAGRRGAGWIKVKPRHTLDLVVLAAEWGHGRRRGWLSNLHLGARADDGSGFVMLGKTFKGLTDELLGWQTEKLLELETRREGITVHVRPELVVEIAFDGVQTSPRYPGGVALRFARVLRYRDDKRADEADTLSQVVALG